MKSPFGMAYFQRLLVSGSVSQLKFSTPNFSDCLDTTPEEVSDLEISLISLEGLFFGEASFSADMLFVEDGNMYRPMIVNHKGE